jgi:anti-sigma-K factor RskA
MDMKQAAPQGILFSRISEKTAFSLFTRPKAVKRASFTHRFLHRAAVASETAVALLFNAYSLRIFRGFVNV